MYASNWEKLGWVAALALIVLATQAVYTAIYRLYFHPLSRFPGPALAKITDLWSVYHNVKGQSHLIIYKLHKRYGPIVRLGPNKLVISSPSAIQNTFLGKNVLKSHVYETLCPAPGVFSLFTSIDPDMHRHKRKVFGPAFSENAVRSFEPEIWAQVDIFIQQIEREIGKQGTGPDQRWSLPLDTTPRARHYATDMIGKFNFGESFGMQTSSENQFLIKALDGAGVVAGMYAQYPRLKESLIGKIIEIAGGPKKERFGQLVQKLIDHRLKQQDSENRDLLSIMKHAAKEDSSASASFTLEEMWAESRIFLFAGAQTTATAISATLFYLSRNEDAYQRLTTLLRNTFSHKRDICLGEQLNKCAWLWACIDESLRLSPPIATVLWRQTVTEELDIDGEPIPAGCDIGASVYVPHHNEDIFSKPFEFRPQRWLATDAQSVERVKAQRLAFNPFGYGTRQCIALKMAYAEIALCLARSLWSLDMRMPDGHLAQVGGGGRDDDTERDREGEFQLYEHINSQTRGPYLEWSLRQT